MSEEEQIRELCLARFGERANFLVMFNPSNQIRFSKHVERCHLGTAPTLAEVKVAYGEKTPTAWLVVQLTDLSEYCGCKDKLSEYQLLECAERLRQRYFYLKVSEFMLFFSRFKDGDYGRFYGSVDPMIISSAMKMFVKERNETMERYESQQRAKQRELEAQGAISRQEYERLKVRAKEGDMEAMKILMGKE